MPNEPNEPNEPNKYLVGLEIKGPEGQIKVDVLAGRPLFILGRNGTGKSALVNSFVAMLRGRVLYMAGSRPSYFDNESLSMTPATRRRFTEQEAHYASRPEARWKSEQGTAINEKAIHDLQTAETQYAADILKKIRSEGKDSIEVDQALKDHSPLDMVNSLLKQANLVVRLKIDGGELRAVQGASLYSYARMSDGERCALLIASQVIAANAGTVFLLDEPELHLHPSIVVSLIKALILQRPDCGFVISTHQLELPAAVENAEIVLVRDSVWSEGKVVSWDFEVIDDPKKIPEWLWVDLIGARRKILFIEGNGKTSLDQSLYAVLFPNVSVRPIESCVNVIRAVDGLRGVYDVHRAEVYGLIDNDGMSADQLREYEERGVYPLPVFAVESLIYAPEVLCAIAKARANSTKTSVDDMLSSASAAAIKSLSGVDKREHLAVRLAERRIRDKLLEKIPTRDQIKENLNGNIEVVIESPYLDELKRLTELVNKCDIDEVVSRYPVRESGVLSCIAKGLEYETRGHYEDFALLYIGRDAELQGVLKQKLGKLAAKLDGQRHSIDAQQPVL